MFLASLRLCVRVFFQSIDDTRNAVLDRRRVEVDRQTKPLICRPRISEKLLSVDRREGLDRLDSDPHRSGDRRDCLLADRLESTLSKLIGEHRKAASTISLAMAFSVMAALYSLSQSRQDARNATPVRAWNREHGEYP